MLKTIKALSIALFIIFSTGSLSAANISGKEYREETIALFKELMEMEDEGVFMNDSSIKVFGKNLPNRIRGSNPPGGYFARPPGSDWMKRIDALDDKTVEGGSGEKCAYIPNLPLGGDLICGFELESLGMQMVMNRDTYTDLLASKFWLMTICQETPQACKPYVFE